MAAAAIGAPISTAASALARASRRLLPFAASLHIRTLPPLAGSLRRRSSAGICDVAHAVKPGRGGTSTDSLPKGVGDKNVLEVVKVVLEMARRASSRREVLHTDFLTPPVLKESTSALEKLSEIKAVSQGGYPQAERCRLTVGQSDIMTIVPDVVAALSISGNFGFEPCSHGDFLGAILNTGIVREKLGDILLQGEKGAHIIIVPELVDFLVSALEKIYDARPLQTGELALVGCVPLVVCRESAHQNVGNVPVSCTQIPLLALEYEPPRTKSFKAIEASVRVDALASAGFKLSRTKLVDLISKGDVRVNWSPIVKNGATLKTGDIVSVSGKGRLKIGEITTTKKGKYAVELIRYL